MIRRGYHTQEKWGVRLSEPILTKNPYAWLGKGFYFWEDEYDAMRWGRNSKKRTGRYEIYIADIEMDNVLDTVFNETHYRFWIRIIEKCAEQLTKLCHYRPTIKDLNEFLIEKGHWNEVTGIMFQDIPSGGETSLVEGLAYRKRIQIAVFSKTIISNFAFHVEEQC